MSSLITTAIGYVPYPTTLGREFTAYFEYKNSELERVLPTPSFYSGAISGDIAYRRGATWSWEFIWTPPGGTSQSVESTGKSGTVQFTGLEGVHGWYGGRHVSIYLSNTPPYSLGTIRVRVHSSLQFSNGTSYDLLTLNLIRRDL